MPLLNVLSDLHLKFAPFSPAQTDADVIVLAGDVHTGTRRTAWTRPTRRIWTIWLPHLARACGSTVTCTRALTT